MIALEFRDKVSCIFESDTRVPTRSLQCQGDSSAGNIPIVNIYSYPYVATAHAHTLTQQCPVLYCLHICDTVVINDYAVARRLSDTKPLSNQMLIFFDNPKNTFWWEEIGVKTQLVGVLKLCPVLDIFFKYGISQYTVYHMHVPIKVSSIQNNITCLFARCRRGLAVGTPVKYECDSKNLAYTFATSHMSSTDHFPIATLVPPPRPVVIVCRMTKREGRSLEFLQRTMAARPAF